VIATGAFAGFVIWVVFGCTSMGVAYLIDSDYSGFSPATDQRAFYSGAIWVAAVIGSGIHLGVTIRERRRGNHRWFWEDDYLDGPPWPPVGW
jgi:hypothetical protein